MEFFRQNVITSTTFHKFLKRQLIAVFLCISLIFIPFSGTRFNEARAEPVTFTIAGVTFTIGTLAATIILTAITGWFLTEYSKSMYGYLSEGMSYPDAHAKATNDATFAIASTLAVPIAEISRLIDENIINPLEALPAPTICSYDPSVDQIQVASQDGVPLCLPINAPDMTLVRTPIAPMDMPFPPPPPPTGSSDPSGSGIESLSRMFDAPIMMAVEQAMRQLYAKYGIDLSLYTRPADLLSIEDSIKALGSNEEFLNELTQIVSVFNNAVLSLYKTSVGVLVQPIAQWMAKVQNCMSNGDFWKLLLAGFGNSWSPPIGIGTAVYTMGDTSINYFKDRKGDPRKLMTSGLYVAVSAYFVYHMVNGYRNMLYPPGMEMLRRIRSCIRAGQYDGTAIDPKWIKGGISNLQLNLGMAGFLLLTKTLLKDVGKASVEQPINQIPIEIVPVFVPDGTGSLNIPAEIDKIEITVKNHEMVMRTEYGDLKLARFSYSKIRGDDDFTDAFELNFAEGAVTEVTINAYSCKSGFTDNCYEWELLYKGLVKEFSPDVARDGAVRLSLTPVKK